ncbi:uncharacterized protein si:dkey-22n8.3 isoform X2 [Pseudorasbora parva]|uniref:uncharacterized protein si:dkey-22n8.3 isoform X2 n=1 Tax=Pseudorasbora parva TaxID=51549 RepID=UPI00351E0FAA
MNVFVLTEPSSVHFLGMFAIMSFQRVRRLRVLKFLWMEDSWMRRKVPPLTTLCTKANYVKKPVRYTSIKKAKPKTINDIARLLQQKTKETKERKQSVIPAAAQKAATSSTTKPATPNQFNDQSDAKATIVSNSKVKTSTSTLPEKVSVEHSEYVAPVDTKQVQYIIDVEAALNAASKLHVSASKTFCKTTPDTAIIDSAVDFAYSKGDDQMAMEGLHNKTYKEISNAKDPAPKAIDSGVDSPTSNAPHEPLAQEEVSELSSTNTKEVIPSCEDVGSAFKKLTPEVVDEIVNMPEVMVTSKVMATPEASSAHEDGHLEESFTASEVVTVTNASTFANIARAQYSSQPQSTQSQDFIAPKWSSNVNADKTPSSQEIINQTFGSFTFGTSESIMDISSAEAVAVACGEVPSLSEVCHKEAIPVSDAIPEVSLFKSDEDLPLVETKFASLSKEVKAAGMTEMSGDAQSSINPKEPIVAQTDVLEEEVQKEPFEEFPEAQLDPIKRLFLDKIREFSTKSQASGGLVDVGQEYEKVFNEELTKLQRLYGGGDLSNFPEFKFSEPVLDESSSK